MNQILKIILFIIPTLFLSTMSSILAMGQIVGFPLSSKNSKYAIESGLTMGCIISIIIAFSYLLSDESKRIRNATISGLLGLLIGTLFNWVRWGIWASI
ncbi:MAG: hypothetical protein AB1798_21085 [Spirochaetota bacterium]